jgi:hypothetical protein
VVELEIVLVQANLLLANFPFTLPRPGRRRLPDRRQAHSPQGISPDKISAYQQAPNPLVHQLVETKHGSYIT